MTSDHIPISKVLIPRELDLSSYLGEVFGYYHQESDIYNILAWQGGNQQLHNGEQAFRRLGQIVSDPATIQFGDELIGVRTDRGCVFTAASKQYTTEQYELLLNVFSRNTGILETDWMLDKTAFILGCGSVGSLVAVELAKAGVGHFVLVDNDVFGYHNICRHQCGVSDVGKYKVTAVRERILDINPYANVAIYIGIVEDLPKSVFDEYCNPGTLLIGCADNREADLYASQLACVYDVPFLAVGFWERAFAGEIFYFVPEDGMPCYECAIGRRFDSAPRPSTSRRVYTTQTELEAVNFEPGISIDIDYVTVIATKIALDLLNRHNPRFTPRLLGHLSQLTLVCNTNEPRIGGEMAEIFAYPLQVTTSIKVDFKGNCPPCKHK